MTGQDIYTDIADQFIAALDRGVAPWRVTRGTGFPTNHSTGRSYSGVNVMNLAWAQMNGERSTSLWLTYKQAQGLGGQVRKGERGTKVLILKPVTRKRPKEGQDSSYMMARSATVFNLDQIDGLDLPELSELPAVEPTAAAEGLVAAYLADGPSLVHGGNRAYYVPNADAITLPPRDHFDSPAAYYSTLFHEIGHSTSHDSRLDRDLASLANVHTYAREELVAEFAAAFLRAHAGIVDDVETEQSAAYLRGWASKIREEPKILTWAASQAQKAVDHVLAQQFAAVAA
jgi:antirestriction protein ArdC